MIPDEAVEAAAKALYERDKASIRFGGPTELPDIRAYMDEARAALGAAVPHLMASALEDAADDLAKINPGPANWLRDRANETRNPH